MSDRIVAAAIRTEDGRIFTVPPPGRHHDVIALMHREQVPLATVLRAEQGFATEKHPFVLRMAALRIAVEAGQFRGEPPAASTTHGLFSEDVW